MTEPEPPNFEIRKQLIHKEMRQHAATFAVWASWVAYLQSKLEQREEELEFICARLRKDARASLIALLGKSGITERAVGDEILAYPEVKRKVAQVRRYKFRVKEAKAVLAGLEVKTSMLQVYVGLRRSEIQSMNGAEE